MFAGFTPAKTSRCASAAPRQSAPGTRMIRVRTTSREGRAELPSRRNRASQRSECLGAAVARVERRAVRAERRRPAHDDPRPGAHGAGVGGGLLEAAALPHLPADQPRNVTVLSVEIFPLPSFCQIS